MSLILDAIKATIPEEHFSLPLSRVGTFAFVTTVKSKRLGSCMTLNDNRVFDFKINLPVSHLGEVHTLSLEKLISWSDSLQGIERSFAVAAINSAIPLDGKKYFKGNALELTARISKGKTVAVVGHFPGMDKIRQAADKFYIIEKRPQPGDLEAEEAVNVIPHADVVTITGVTCLNDTMEGLLALKKPGATIILLGPSVPMSSVLFDFGVDVIGGAWVENEESVYMRAKHGGAPRYLTGMQTVLYPKDPEFLTDYEEIVPPTNIL